MWTQSRPASRPQRTPSVHSIASVSSAGRPASVSNRSDIDDIPLSRSNSNTVPAIWQTRQHSPHSFKRMPESDMKVHQVRAIPPGLAKIPPRIREWNDPIDDDDSYQSPTLDGNEDLTAPPPLEKKSVMPLVTRIGGKDEPRSPMPAPHVPGPLESQLASLMSKLIFMERENPAVSVKPDEFKEVQARLKALEAEKKTWTKRHEAIWKLRDEDVENNIKIRGYLAKARRELEGMTKLRDEDLLNVQLVRSKLAEKTREIERLQGQGGRVSPHRGRPSSFERRDTADLFTMAKTAALEQRVLELEKRNSDLIAQVDTLKGGANIDDLNRLTAHQAWKDTVAGLEAKLKAKDAELARMKQGGHSAAPSGGMDWARMEAMFEEHADYREAVGGKLQLLRSEKEALQKEYYRKENECQALELKVRTLQRRATMFAA